MGQLSIAPLEPKGMEDIRERDVPIDGEALDALGLTRHRKRELTEILEQIIVNF